MCYIENPCSFTHLVIATKYNECKLIAKSFLFLFFERDRKGLTIKKFMYDS